MNGGEVGILNVGAGDTKLSFDPKNPAERIRAARIVKDMLRRGYALMVEVKRKGKKAYERVLEFREDTCEYIIADYDPLEDETRGEEVERTARAAHSPTAPDAPAGKAPNGRRRGRRAVDAGSAPAVAVARSAGG